MYLLNYFVIKVICVSQFWLKMDKQIKKQIKGNSYPLYITAITN